MGRGVKVRIAGSTGDPIRAGRDGSASGRRGGRGARPDSSVPDSSAVNGKK
jgi:hypothetical protein